MAQPLRVLIVQDRPTDAEVVAELRRAGFAPDWHNVGTEEEFLKCLKPEVDVILSGYDMPEFSGLRALELLQNSGLEIPFIFISGTIGEDIAVAAMKQGAADYLLRDGIKRLGTSVGHALEMSRQRRQRKLAEEELRTKNAHFRQLLDHSPAVIYTLKVAGGNVIASIVSKNIERHLGFDVARCDYAWWEAHLHPQDKSTALASVAQTLQLGALRCEYRLQHADGHYVWVEDNRRLIRDSSGKPSEIVGVWTDITERKYAEEVFRESERFREMLENVELVAMTLDHLGRVTFCNDHLLKVTGWNRQEVIGADWCEKFLPCNPELKQKFLYHIESGSIPAHYENPISTCDGQLRDIVWNNTMLRDEAGNIQGTASIGEDVTERKRVEERVREQAAMLDHAHEAIIACDIGTCVITYWNRGAERLYGWSAVEANRRDIRELIFADADGAAIVTDELLKSGECRGEYRHVSKDGRELMISGHTTLMRDSRGAPKSLLVINIDITEQKSLEARFMRAQRMESIGTLAGGIAHDLNNVLAPILMGVDYLKEKYPDASKILSQFEISANRGAGMVRQLLTFAKGARGERVSIQTAHLVLELKELMQGTFPKNIGIQVLSPPHLPTVLGDASQLHQILLNLCVNARDAMPSGGTLTLESQVVDIDAIFAATVPDARPGTYVALRVTDTGTGIPSNVMDRIFDPFFTTKGPDKGTGLGLSTVMGVVKGMGGFLHVLSTVGRGSAFTAYLPAEKTDTSSTVFAAAMPPHFRGHGETILLVDDEISLLEVGRLVLTELNFKVVTAADGADGVVKVAEHRHELRAVITDLHMPHMDGLSFVRALRRVLPDIPVIIGSGRLDDEVAEELKSLHVTHRLDKPYSQEMLAMTLAKLLDVNQARLN